MQFVLLSLLLTQNLFAAPLFLQLNGHSAGHSTGQIYHDLTVQFLSPLEKTGATVRFSQVSQAYGDGYFFLNLILEGDQALVDQYVGAREGRDFYGTSVRFESVVQIRETAELEAGIYVDNSEDPFDPRAKLSREFRFSSIAGWMDFSNGYGRALQSPRNGDMIAYLRAFIGDDPQFSEFRDHVLSVSNMLAIFPQVSLVLESGRTVGPEFETTPFLPYRFFRNCYSARFDNGMCWKN